jgi:hypothetical protein
MRHSELVRKLTSKKSPFSTRNSIFRNLWPRLISAVALTFPVSSPTACRLEAASAQHQPNAANAATEPKFTLILVGNGLTPDGIPTDFKKFKSSDGNILSEMWIDFGAAARAAKEQHTLTKQSVKTIREKPELDSQGNKVGNRILVLRRQPRNHKIEAVLAWTTGTRYQEIRSNSLEDVLAFEQAISAPK